ncbi:MAG: hypothetical protein LLF90_02320 [Methanomicrobiaceae archaeon]|uniref:hypothetical protein n=1 Tax=Methanoculleus sp. TaxID=90427 RepID=UPI00320E7BDA|nr:hypothetical protein [Methanomicrobiaceae archaeon]
MIREMVLLGAAAYIVIALLQWMENQTVQGEAVTLAVLLAALSLAHFTTGEKWLKRFEMAGLWLMIALFVGYALAKAEGIL